jgi:hypothetical protein
MATAELKLCTLQVNVGTGAWRTVMDFEVEDSDDVMDLAEKLFEWGHTISTKGIRLRIMKPGDTAPLMLWSENDGWEAWDKVPA